MDYDISFAKKVSKELEPLPHTIKRRIIGAIEKLRTNPRPDGVKKLSTDSDLYRIRIGSYRVIYSVNDKKLVVLILRAGHRKEVYDQL